jgi:hypothetical protein
MNKIVNTLLYAINSLTSLSRFSVEMMQAIIVKGALS